MQIKYNKQVDENIESLEDLLTIALEQKCSSFEYPTYLLPWQKFHVVSIQLVGTKWKGIYIYKVIYNANIFNVSYITYFAKLEDKYFPVYQDAYDFIVGFKNKNYLFINAMSEKNNEEIRTRSV